MAIIPTVRCRRLAVSLAFYTTSWTSPWQTDGTRRTTTIRDSSC